MTGPENGQQDGGQDDVEGPRSREEPDQIDQPDQGEAAAGANAGIDEEDPEPAADDIDTHVQGEGRHTCYRQPEQWRLSGLSITHAKTCLIDLQSIATCYS